jgi:hypothetical protein
VIFRVRAMVARLPSVGFTHALGAAHVRRRPRTFLTEFPLHRAYGQAHELALLMARSSPATKSLRLTPNARQNIRSSITSMRRSLALADEGRHFSKLPGEL